MSEEWRDWQGRIEELEAVIAKLVEALVLYGEHQGDCNADLSEGDDIYQCTCGLDAALAGAKEGK